jgi:acylphosphatase
MVPAQSGPIDLARLHLTVTGRVQGVGFRNFVQIVASRSALAGWVRNLGYDQVEVIAEGSRAVLERFVEQVKQGPPGSRVDEAHEQWETFNGEFKRFDVRSSR